MINLKDQSKDMFQFFSSNSLQTICQKLPMFYVNVIVSKSKSFSVAEGLI